MDLDTNSKSYIEGYGFEADIFSLGVTLYYLYNQKVPWETVYPHNSSKMKEEYRKKLSLKDGIFSEEMNICKEAKDLILKMMAFEKNARISLEEIKKHPFMNQTKEIEKFKGICIEEANKIQFLQKTLDNIYEFDVFCEKKCVWIRALFNISKFIKKYSIDLSEIAEGKQEKKLFDEEEWEYLIKNSIYQGIKQKIKQMKKNSTKNFNAIELKILRCEEKLNDFTLFRRGNLKSSIQKLLIEYKDYFQKDGRTNKKFIEALDCLILVAEEQFQANFTKTQEKLKNIENYYKKLFLKNSFKNN